MSNRAGRCGPHAECHSRVECAAGDLAVAAGTTTAQWGTVVVAFL
ncbi:hypothetical protein [Streptomyces sp. ERV7]|nr:hypothetical protein [Streptomyces sp. ERV7]